jgi:hypothetical protein
MPGPDRTVPRGTVAVLLAVAGLVVVVAGLFLLPWTSGGGFYLENRPHLAEFYTYADVNAKLIASYHAWGYLLFVCACVAALFLVNRGRSAGLVGLAAVVLGAVWHQVGIGTLTNLTVVPYLPEVGAGLIAVGFLVSLAGRGVSRV